MKGITRSIDNHGTIVTLWVAVSPDDPSEFRLYPVHFDHRMFQHLVDSRSLDGILNQSVEVFDDGLDGLQVLFLDDVGGCDICGGDCGESHALRF